MTPEPDDIHRFRRTVEGLVGIPATEGNQVDVLRNGDEIFPAMLEAIAAARATVDLLTFIYWKGQIARDFADVLSERARAGLRVRILLDAVGARLIDKDILDQVARAGATVEWFRKPTNWKVWEHNHRTHRKVLVCDEEVAFTGGVGIAEEWCGDARGPAEWRDTHFRVRGPAVDGVRAGFASNWAETGHPLFDDRDRFPDQPRAGDACVQVVRGSAGVDWTDMATVFAAVIRRARRRLRLTTAYFVPDERFVDLLVEAVDRGVAVEVLLPGPHADKRIVQLASEVRYEPLLDAGVQMWCFQPSMLHAKVLTADGVVACVGSANFNSRSMTLDDEVDMVVLHAPTVAVLDRHFEEDLARSEELDPSRWADRNLAQKVKEKASTLLDDHF